MFVCVSGNIGEERFVQFFEESLKGEEPEQFDSTMAQFMVCAKECRQAKVEERTEAERKQADVVRELTEAKEELEARIGECEQSGRLELEEIGRAS